MKDPMKKGKNSPEKRVSRAQKGTYFSPTFEVKKLSQIVTLTGY